MGMRHFWQRTPRYHRVSALGHREIFNESHSHQRCGRHLESGLYLRNDGISVLIRTNARNRLCAISLFFAVPECAFGCAAWLCADDENAHDRRFFSTCSPPLDFTHSSGDSKFSMHKDSSWKYSTATRKTVQE